MDNQRFDRLAKTFATRASRRQVVRGFGGTLFAGSAAALGLTLTERQLSAARGTCGGANAQCSQDSDCCAGKCEPNGLCANTVAGDPCDPSSSSSCIAAGLVCCVDSNSSTGGTCTPLDMGCRGQTQCSPFLGKCDTTADCCVGKCTPQGHICSNLDLGDPCDASNPGSCLMAGAVCCPNSEDNGGTCTAIDQCSSATATTPPSTTAPTSAPPVSSERPSSSGPVNSLPNTGSGTAAGKSAEWVTPAAVIGAAGAVFTAVRRRARSENE